MFNLVKAKRKDNGDWIHGTSFMRPDGHCFITTDQGPYSEVIEVDPVTVTPCLGATTSQSLFR